MIVIWYRCDSDSVLTHAYCRRDGNSSWRWITWAMLAVGVISVWFGTVSVWSWYEIRWYDGWYYSISALIFLSADGARQPLQLRSYPTSTIVSLEHRYQPLCFATGCLRFNIFCWVGKRVNIVKPTSPTQGQANPRKKGLKVAFGPLFPAANKFSWVGIGFR